MKDIRQVIQHNKPTLGTEEIVAAKRVIESQWVAQGQEVKNFENEFCDFLGIKQGCAIAVSNCTSAIFIALTILNGEGKRVAFPAYTCSALRNAVGLSGGQACVVDSAHDSPNIDIAELNALNPDIAIIPHMYGLPVDVNAVSKNILVIEDCAQALGAKINGSMVGLKGKISVFSFYASKLITSGGQGGMIVSQDKALIEKIKDYREFDQRNDDKQRFNFQITDIQAAIGRAQLEKANRFIQRRQEIFSSYLDAGLPMLLGDGQPVRYRGIMLSNDVEKILRQLREKGIKAINPLEEWELLSDKISCKNAYAWTQKTVSLPIYPDLTDLQVNKIIESVKKL